MMLTILFYVLLSYCFVSCSEYVAHRWYMHKKIKGFEDVFSNHKIHHAIYRSNSFSLDVGPEKRFINLSICAEHSALFVLPLLVLSYFTLGIGFIAVLLVVSVLHFLLYNIIHSSLHLNHKLNYFPKWYTRLILFNHFMHHQHPTKHFCVAAPGVDYLVGTVAKLTAKDKKAWSELLAKQQFDRSKDKKELDAHNFCKIPAFLKWLKFVSTDGNVPPRPSKKSMTIGRMICNTVRKMNLITLKVHYSERILTDRLFVLASNHSSWLDVFILPCITKQPTRLAAAESVIKFNWLFTILFVKFLGAFPMKTSKSVDAAVAILNSGQNIAICPEGWVSWIDHINKIHTGAVRIAKGSGSDVEIVPINIKYEHYPGKWILRLPFILQCIVTSCLFSYRGTAHVYIGFPYKPERDVLEETNVLQCQLLSKSLLNNF